MVKNEVAPGVSTGAFDSLADLAGRIRAEHEALQASMKRGVQHALAAGVRFEGGGVFPPEEASAEAKEPEAE